MKSIPLFLREDEHDKMVSINGKSIKNQVIGDFNGSLLLTSTLGKLFQRYADDPNENGMNLFLNDRYAYRAPNADIIAFLYDPFTGEKIDWNRIKEVYNV